MTLPHTPKDIFRFKPPEWVAFNGLIAFFRATGLWRYPIEAQGDLEKMRFLDKVYWVYKAVYPTRRARKGSGLETYFAAPARRECRLPEGFVEERELELSSVGDLMDHPYLPRSRGTLYRDVADLIFGVDLAMANLECPVVEEAKGELAFDTNVAPGLYYGPASFAAAKGHEGRQFDFMATACNHSLDFGVEGVESTRRALANEGIASSGLNGTEADASRVTIVERAGVRIGAVAYTFGLNALRPPADRPRIVNRMHLNEGVSANDFAQLSEQLEDARAKGVEFLVAHLHWGLEHEFYPIPAQVELAHHLAELGVDAVVGHHPHVVQPFELYRTRRNAGRVVPIFYSLGNLTTPFSAAYLRRSAVARMTLAIGKLDGARRVYVKHANQVEVDQEVDETQQALRLKRVE